MESVGEKEERVVVRGLRADDLESCALAAWGLGQVAFEGLLNAVSDNKGIWATDVCGALHLVLRQGDTVEVATSTGREGTRPSALRKTWVNSMESTPRRVVITVSMRSRTVTVSTSIS